MHGSASALTHIEQASATGLCNMVLHSPAGNSRAHSTVCKAEKIWEDSVREDSENESSDKDGTSTLQSPCSPHCYSESHCCHPNSWMNQCEMEDEEGMEDKEAQRNEDDEENKEDYTEKSSGDKESD